MYVVFESYYKNAEVNMTIINSDEEMLEYCRHSLQDYYEWSDDDNIINNDVELFVDNMIAGLDLNDIIKITISKGNKNIKDQTGWGVRYIIKGNDLVEIN